MKKATANEQCGDQNRASVATVETDDSFAAWGIGKHACPGRYFAVDIVKIIMTHILEKYEVGVLVERAPNWWI